MRYLKKLFMEKKRKMSLREMVDKKYTFEDELIDCKMPSGYLLALGMAQLSKKKGGSL